MYHLCSCTSFWPLFMARLRSAIYGLSPPLHAYHMLVAHLVHYILSHASLMAYWSMFASHLHLIWSAFCMLNMIDCITFDISCTLVSCYISSHVRITCIALLGLGCQTKCEGWGVFVLKVTKHISTLSHRGPWLRHDRVLVLICVLHAFSYQMASLIY